MTRPPLVSVVMPVYDRVSTVAAAVSSVLWQTHEHLELIVVDDGSRDGSADLVAAVADPRVRLLRQDNQGAAAARNRGMLEAGGDLVSFLDSDDVLFPQHLEALVHTWQARGGIATANAHYLLPGGISPTGLRHRGRFPSPHQQRLALLQQNFVSPMSVFPRRMLDEVGAFDTGLARNEDWDLWLRAVFAGYRVAHQPRALALYRWTSSSLSTDLDLVFADEDRIMRRMASRDDVTPAERSYLDRRLREGPPRRLALEADAALRAGRYPQAARGYAAAASLCPAETLLVRKARAMAVAPRVVGPLLRRRQSRSASYLGVDEGNTR